MAVVGGSSGDLMQVAKQHQDALKARSQKTWDQYVGGSRVREAVFALLAVLGAASGFIGIYMAKQYASTITQVHDTRQVDRYGQLIGHDVSVVRIPADAAPGMLITGFVMAAYANYHSYLAMVTQHNDSLRYVAAGKPAEAEIKQEWNQWSVLAGDGTTYDATRPENDVEVNSVLDHGVFAPGVEDYLVQFTTKIYDDARRGDYKQLWTADIHMEAGGPKTDASPLGLYIVEVKTSKVEL